MIWYLIGIPLLGLLTAGMAILPTPEALPNGFAISFQEISVEIGHLGNIIDLSPWIEVIGLMLVIYGYAILWMVLNWVIKKIRGSG